MEATLEEIVKRESCKKLTRKKEPRRKNRIEPEKSESVLKRKKHTG